jgi:transcriptional regulator with GAF, ATPase, and Fis domain
MVTVNCAAFGDTLLESELFGHEKGAFTGADQVRRGKFEQASGGTLFLDEIAHMSLPFQQKILRVVEYSTYHRVGGSGELKSTARVIAATNCDLNAKIHDGQFLSDLYDRLSFEVVEVAPLRRRRSDIEPLAQHFLDQFAREIPAFAGKRLSQAAIDMLKPYHFPGNVRELKNIIERAAYRDTTNEITPEDIGMLAEEQVLGKGTFKEKIDAFSRRLILDSLSHSGGNQAQAARLLGLSYHQFRYYAKKLGE